jgi:hypothetical protein
MGGASQPWRGHHELLRQPSTRTMAAPRRSSLLEKILYQAGLGDADLLCDFIGRSSGSKPFFSQQPVDPPGRLQLRANLIADKTFGVAVGSISRAAEDDGWGDWKPEVDAEMATSGEIRHDMYFSQTTPIPVLIKRGNSFTGPLPTKIPHSIKRFKRIVPIG